MNVDYKPSGVTVIDVPAPAGVAKEYRLHGMLPNATYAVTLAGKSYCIPRIIVPCGRAVTLSCLFQGLICANDDWEQGLARLPLTTRSTRRLLLTRKA